MAKNTPALKIKDLSDPQVAEMEKVTYRLALVDSKNRAVQIDIEHNDLIKEGTRLHELYDAYQILLEKELKDISLSEQHDKEVKTKVDAVQKKKIEELEAHECEVCNHKWKGGTNVCPKCSPPR